VDGYIFLEVDTGRAPNMDASDICLLGMVWQEMDSLAMANTKITGTNSV